MQIEVFVLLFLYSLVLCEEKPLTDGGVYILNTDNFENFINENNVVLVEFYAPWCGHCKNFAPVYVQIAKELNEIDPPIPVAKIDATTETSLAQRFKIQGYPTLKYFKNGKEYDYDGDRGVDIIVKFMKGVSQPDWEEPKDHVLKLTKDNFTENLEKHNYILVEFYAPWCGHCKSLAPEYAKAARILAKNDPPIPLAAVDATVETDISKLYQVTGYPTLKLFRDQKPYDYNGPRQASGIVEWLLNNLKNAAKLIKTQNEIKNMLYYRKSLVLGLFTSEQNSLFANFIGATNNYRETVNSAYTFQNIIRKFYKLKHFEDSRGSIVVVKPEYFQNKYDAEYVEYKSNENNDSVQAIQSFILDNMFPLVGEFNAETEPIYQLNPKELTCYFFFTVDFTVQHRSATQHWMKKIADIAINYNNIRFLMADDETQQDLLSRFRLDESGEDISVGCSSNKSVKYRMPPMDEFSSSFIRDFLDNILQGKLYPSLKSSPVPHNPVAEDRITTVVGDTYRKLVDLNKSPISIILLFQSVCRDDCLKQRQLVGSLRDTSSISIFSMDISANDLPHDTKLGPGIYMTGDNSDGKSLFKPLISVPSTVDSNSALIEFIKTNSPTLKDEL